MSILNIFRRDEGGIMDVIRCDAEDYLVHRWTPGNGENSSRKEHSIRYGSRLWVRPGEAAVFLYPNDRENPMDIIHGPYDDSLKTANFPILSDLVGMLFGGDEPFLAEVYFFNLEQNIQIRFGIPYFDIFDNRFPDLGVPCAVRGTVTFNISNIPAFIRQYRLQQMDIPELEGIIKDYYVRKAKSIVLNIPTETNLPLMQLERNIDTVSDLITERLRPEIEEQFGLNLKRVDISALELDTTSPRYMQLKGATADLQTRIAGARTEVEITNLTEYARIQRKDIEMGVEGKNFAVHQVNQQADVLKTAAGNLGGSGSDGHSGSGFSPAGIMAGMAMGGAMGNLMGSMGQTPPPPPVLSYHIAINGQQSGPYTVAQLKEFAQNGQFTKQHHIWKPGMAGWELAETAPAMAEVFGQVPPPPPAP